MLMRKVLVANRGEIAARVIRTAKRLGLATVAVHSAADTGAYHLREADEAVAIGGSEAPHSYLNGEHILQAARASGADALHPGAGFLSEDADFAAAVRTAGLNFIGPPTAAMATMGNKTAARAAAQAANVPVLNRSEALSDAFQARVVAHRMGYPVLDNPTPAGSGLYLQNNLGPARHVEVQIAADQDGNMIHLGERECSIQRHCHKLLEEAPSPAVDDKLRARMTAAAVRLGRHVGFQSLGTVEMLVQGDAFYFFKMNTRLQIEHTVTEMVSGLDLVEWQLRIAMGERLPASQAEIVLDGHALQCRIRAEDPSKGFEPACGTITAFQLPRGDGVRNDVGIQAGDNVTPFYDPLLAKLIVHGASRAAAIARLRQALKHYRVEGVTTNLSMHRQIVAHAAFLRGELDTQFLSAHLGYPGA